MVMDMTMCAEYSPAEVASLKPYGVVVNVHARCRDALARWEGKINQEGGGPHVEAPYRSRPARLPRAGRAA